MEIAQACNKSRYRSVISPERSRALLWCEREEERESEGEKCQRKRERERGEGTREKEKASAHCEKRSLALVGGRGGEKGPP